MATIITDTREKALFDILGAHGAAPIMQRMDVADVEIRAPGVDRAIVVFERKTLADLESSIKDGRYKEQKFRLMNACDAYHKAYVVEGMWGDASEMSRGAIINTMFRDGIQVLMVPSLQDTASFLIGCAKRVGEAPAVYIGGTTPAQDYTTSVSTSKKANMTPQAFAAIALAQIPGLSVGVAKTILDHFGGSMAQLVNSYTVEEAKNLQVSSKRRLGAKLANRILDFLGVAGAPAPATSVKKMT